MKKKISIIQRLIEKFFGRIFYICIVGYKGSNKYFVNSDIYRSLEAAQAYKKHIEEECPTLVFIGIYPFRSKNDFCLKISVSNFKPVTE